MTSRLVLVGCLGLACADDSLKSTGSPPAAPQGQPQEACNGRDDDHDGEIDEGFADGDADGLADCVDTSCSVSAIAPSQVATDDGCLISDDRPETEDPWNIVIEWQWTGAVADPGINQVIIAPMIGQVAGDPTPDVAFVAFAGYGYGEARLVLVDGKHGEEHWSIPGFAPYGGVAIADVDGNGAADVVGFLADQRVTAIDGSGTTLWTSPRPISTYAPQATVADLDGDGTPEVIADALVLNGRTGEVLGEIPVSGSIPYRVPAVADIDLDGRQEVLLGDVCWSLTAGVVWQSTLVGTYGHWNAVLQYDDDPKGEVAMVAGGYYAIYEADGHETLRVPAGTGQPGPPCVADFDGDGSANIAWASTGDFTMRRLDGSAVWTQPVSDMSGLAGCSGYDFNGDGVYELLFADEQSLQVFDGRTGEVRHRTDGHASGTLWEYPTVADVDGDGSAELVIASNNYGYAGWAGITAFGHVENGWMKSGDSWGLHDFAVTNVGEGASVPKHPTPSWQAYNVYRARPSQDDVGSDLQGRIAEACWSGCNDADPVQVVVVLENHGVASSAGNTEVALYNDTYGVLIGLDVYASTLASGEASAGIVFEMTAGDVGPGPLLLIVDELNEQLECNDGNNTATWVANPCP
jgi:hypothetical protein